MSGVFISYRQTDSEQIQRVREFAQRLCTAGIEVVLDQFIGEEKPAGPTQRWAQWCAERAFKTEKVVIIGTHAWFQCFEGTQQPGTGLGAAYEADAIRQRIYEAGGLNNDIRVVLLDNSEAEHIPAELRGYHYFLADRDFARIVRWLGGKYDTGAIPFTSIPHNLPSLQPFFGREDELKKIADALDPESRTWGALIDGPGGMGKTSLAVRAAYDASPDTFDKIIFVSLKSRELDDDGVRDLSGFLISGLAELLNELARELGHAAITKAPGDQRPRMLLDALRGTRTLLILDNLESLVKKDRDTVFTFVKRLPPGCKAILTSRQRIGSAAEELILKKLSKHAALATLAKLAESNQALSRTSKADRIDLYNETGGNPLLLRWTAGQIGRGSCVTFSNAIDYLRSCPEGNDPLEFIFSDLVEGFSLTETQVLCALSYFTLPVSVEHITELAECAEADTDTALRSLINRSLVVPSEELKTFALVPLVIHFLLKKKPEIIAETGDRLEDHVYALVVQDGYNRYNRYPVLDAAWPKIAASLPRFIGGPNDRLQIVSHALTFFLDFSGRWDEELALMRDAEERALAENDFLNAGWRAQQAGWVYHARGEASKVLTCANRAETHWRAAKRGPRERALATRLRAIGYQLAKNYGAAISAHRKAVGLWRRVGPESGDVAIGLNDLAVAERLNGDFDSAQRHFCEALEIAQAAKYYEVVATCTVNLAALALDKEDWAKAEILARDGLRLIKKIGREEVIALACLRLAMALLAQGKRTNALRYAKRSVKNFTRLGSRYLNDALGTLAACERYRNTS